MCSNTHSAVRSPSTPIRVSIPSGVSETISPGWTSRRKVAPMMSNAQDSDATQYWSPSMPSDSGRMPAGSRKATTRSRVMTTVE